MWALLCVWAAACASALAPPRIDTWRVFNVDVALKLDPGKDDVALHAAVVTAVNARLSKALPVKAAFSDMTVVRKAFDGRWKKHKSKQPRFVYTVDVRVSGKNKLVPQEGQLERLFGISAPPETQAAAAQKRVVVVGLGPAGLFAALALADAGAQVLVLERGQPVEVRGRDIGALFARGKLNGESNLCYGEGGAGTWSDGKLTTRIGKNSDDVRNVLQRLVDFGAPERILVDSKPHLGTDRLVKILQAARKHLVDRGVEFRFGTEVSDLVVSDDADASRAVGCVLSDGSVLDGYDAVVLAIGHSARQLYQQLHRERGVAMASKAIACGFRIEHPQDLINEIQYGAEFAPLASRGKGAVPVADYRLVAQVPSEKRAAYSFCMCPGGQVVPTAVEAGELSVNGMSFSRRQSQWANSGLVVTIGTEDYAADLAAAGIAFDSDDPLIGVEWQRLIERRASELGGGGLVCPVQTLPDFLAGVVTVADADLPPSSYRLGIKSAACHGLYSSSVTESLRVALKLFDKQLPGYISPRALLHGVETRTSAPVQITRDSKSLESSTLAGLFPCGEGAGYAGGIVSAAVDGVRVAKKILDYAHTPS